MHEILEAFLQTNLLWQSLLGTFLIGLNFSLLGTTLVEKKLSLIGDTFSHAILPGVVLGVYFWGPTPEALLVGGGLAGLLLFFLTQLLVNKRRGHYESAFAFLAVFFVAIGMILSFKTRTSSEILHLLLGNVLAFDRKLLLITAAISLISWGFFYVARHLWSLWILDPDFVFPKSHFYKSCRMTAPVLLILNLTLGLHALGALMTVGLLVIPALTAQLYAVRLYSRVMISAGISAFCCLAGFLISYQWDWPLGPSLVLAAGVLYWLSLGFKGART